GGMCLTDDPKLAAKLRTLRNHGQFAPGQFQEPGNNFRLSEIAAAIGIAQMKRLGLLLESRQKIAVTYRAKLPELSFQKAPEGCTSNHQTFGVLLPEETTLEARQAFIDLVRNRGIEVSPLSYALHLLPSIHRCQHPSPSKPLSVTEALVRRCIALPLYSALTEADQQLVVDAVRAAWQHCFKASLSVPIKKGPA